MRLNSKDFIFEYGDVISEGTDVVMHETGDGISESCDTILEMAGAISINA